ncbi:Clp protease N-terminal domain-containing protein [Nonomuraea sp. M3C6]|uniref:Clp protease N-terminal domain-containing protein n=1 Tax=Nonomuraea marmarensis TaxID=3351344 RepID=A0ABW7A5M1_9ACTN
MGDEHVLLGILRHGDNPAARLLRTHGLELADARERLREIGPALRPHVDGCQALRAFGVDPDELRQRLQAAFGSDAVAAAERRVRCRPWWRGGRTGWARPCTFLLAKRAFGFAARIADRQKAPGVGPEHLLYGVLHDALDPVGTQLSRKGRRQLAEYAWQPGRPNPLRLLLESRDLDPVRLRAQLCAEQGWPT